MCIKWIELTGFVHAKPEKGTLREQRIKNQSTIPNLIG